MITDEEKMRIMRANGLSYRKIADAFGCSTTRVITVIDPSVNQRRRNKKRAARQSRRPQPEPVKQHAVTRAMAIDAYLDGDRRALRRWIEAP